MKKLVFAASLFAVSFFGAYAQDEAGIKPTAGEVTGEYVLSNNFNLGLNNNLLRFRYFFADDMAARVGFRVFRESDRVEVQEAGTNNVGTYRTRASNLTINLGVEKHFSGTNRLSPYVGADLLLSFSGERVRGENVNEDGTAYVADQTFDARGYNVAGEETAGTGIGLRLVGGADVYVAKHVFLGGEFGLSYLLTNRSDVQATVTTPAGSFETTEEQGRSMTLQPELIGGLRIGFVF